MNSSSSALNSKAEHSDSKSSNHSNWSWKNNSLAAQQFAWQRHGGRGGWWTESTFGAQTANQPFKLSVVCGALADQCFVRFAENGCESFCEDELSGIFVKVAGPHA